MQSPVSNNTNNTGSSSIVEVNVPLFNGLAAMNRAYGEEVVRACAAHFGFDAEAAISQFIKPRQLEKAARIPKEKKAKATKAPKPEKPAVSAIPLPWTGEVRPGFCTGLRLNHGLHTQCTMVPMAGGCYCKTCQKQADSNANGKPTYGCVEDRQAVGLSRLRRHHHHPACLDQAVCQPLPLLVLCEEFYQVDQVDRGFDPRRHLPEGFVA